MYAPDYIQEAQVLNRVGDCTSNDIHQSDSDSGTDGMAGGMEDVWQYALLLSG